MLTALIITLSILVGLIGILVIFIISIYNSMVSLRELVNEGWSSIDVQLKLRFNLINNLVSAVKGYAKHEAETLEKVTQERASAYSDDPDERAGAEKEIGGALINMLSVAEAYPELKANDNFINLQKELSEIEDAIQRARRYDNGTARDYNTMIAEFPGVLLASQFQFSRASFFELEAPEQRELPEVNFE